MRVTTESPEKGNVKLILVLIIRIQFKKDMKSSFDMKGWGLQSRELNRIQTIVQTKLRVK